MNHIEDTYLDGIPTPSQLEQLKEKMDSCTDEQLEKLAEQRWESGQANTDGVSQETLDKMYDSIVQRLGFSRHEETDEGRPLAIGRRILRWAQWAALFLLPLSIALTLYIQKENARMGTQTAMFATSPGQQGKVKLPDGTSVSMNQQSTLTYRVGQFAGRERGVDFDGEAFFQVAKDPRHPFVIHSGDIVVSVLGTKFNLLSRNADSIATLTLVEGSVRFETVSGQQSVVLRPGQQIVYNKRSHQIKVATPEDVTDATAWQRGEMVFRSEPVGSVLRRLASSYHLSLSISRGVPLNDRFTGVMSSSNLDEDISILELTNRISIKVKGRTLFVAAR